MKTEQKKEIWNALQNVKNTKKPSQKVKCLRIIVFCPYIRPAHVLDHILTALTYEDFLKISLLIQMCFVSNVF